MYGEQKAVRVKRIVDRKKVSKLQPEKRFDHLSRQKLKENLKIDSKKDAGDSVLKDKNVIEDNNVLSQRRAPAMFEQGDAPEDDDITAEEAQMFEQENKALYEEMNSMSEEVKKVESQVVEIAKLQEIFTEKILEQDVQMNQINSTAVGATENIIDGNEEIRKAMRKKSEFRVMILFFLLVCTLSLLFLDWYNN